MKNKQYTVVWSEEVQYSATVYARDEASAHNKFVKNDIHNQQVEGSIYLDDSMEITEDDGL